MSELDLYKWISENSIEWRKEDNEGVEDFLIFPSIYQIDDFYEMLSPCVFDDGGIMCRMKDGYFAIWMKDICGYHGIQPENVFKEDRY